MGKHLLSAAVLIGSLSLSTSCFAAIRLDLTYTSTQESRLGTVVHDGFLQFILANNDVKVFDRADGENKLIATRSAGSGYLFGPVDFNVTLAPNTVDLYADYSSHTLHTHVTTDGKSTCEAEITNKLKPDQSVYKYVYPKIGPVDVYKLTITHVACRLTQIDDPVAEKPAAETPVAAGAPPAATHPNTDVKPLALANPQPASPPAVASPEPAAQAEAPAPEAPLSVAKVEMPEEAPAAKEAAPTPAPVEPRHTKRKTHHAVAAKQHVASAKSHVASTKPHVVRTRYRVASEHLHPAIRAAIRRFIIDNGF